jgi:hypothetical protein
MSVLGDVARVSPAELERLRTDRHRYDYLSGPDVPKVDLDRYWDVLRFLMDAAGFSVNPIGGEPYPDEMSAWGHGMPHSISCALGPDEVRHAAALLAATPFSALEAHLAAANAEVEYPMGRDWTEPDRWSTAADFYRMLGAFFQEAAAAGQCTVFWAA